MRKLTVVSLSGLICLLGVSPALAQISWSTLADYEKSTGNEIEEFHEAPMLRTMVAAGELPPVEERLPEEPMVIEPLEEIGKYGGLWQIGAIIRECGTLERAGRGVGAFTPDGERLVPNVAKGWDLSDDYKTLTLYLRKGMKWSDGAPFTADDILFWYKDIILNDKLTPVKPKQWIVGGEPMKVGKVDDYTVQFEFSAPYPRATEVVADLEVAALGDFFPKHYLKKYHIKYNPEADKIAEEKGFGNWWELFQWYADTTIRQNNVNIPVVKPWVLKKIDAAQNTYWERNPYYWKVDTAGNQLPYIDALMTISTVSPEVIALKAMGGEFTIQRTGLNFPEYPIYKKNEKEGGYKICLYESAHTGSAFSYAFNYTHKDPVLRKMFNDIRFRQATSLAINREEIGKTVFYGKTIPYMPAVPASWSGFEDWMRTYYTEYDPQKANELLDEMGLKWDKDHQYRLRPDGKRLHILAEYCLQWMGVYPNQVLELMKEYWAKVGINMSIKQVTERLNMERMMANEHDLSVWNADGAAEDLARTAYPIRLMPPWHWADIAMGGTEWRKWYDTQGKEGEEPPGEIKKIFNLVDEWLATPRGSEKYVKLANELITLNVKGLYLIGTVSGVPWSVIIRNDLGNVVREGGLFPYSMRPAQWFLRK